MSGIPEEILRRGEYMTRAEVLDLLGVKPQTLYSYVSRGLVRSVPHPDGRSHLYVREDVQTLHLRVSKRARLQSAAATAMRWGEPVTLTNITELSESGPRYRNRLATDLARARIPFENVAEFLWTGEMAEEPLLWKGTPEPRGLDPLLEAGTRLHREAHILQLMALTVIGLGVAEGSRRERIREGSTPILGARRLIRALAGSLGFLGKSRRRGQLRDGESIAAGILRVVGAPQSDDRTAALDAALVTVADHELNPATFAARVAASGSADIHSCIGAALQTHYGTLVGRTCDRIEQLFAPPADPDTVLGRSMTMLSAARSLPGFNHPLYPGGDPRARLLIELALMTGGSRPVVANMLMTLRRLEDEFSARPTVECGLVVLCRALGLPNQAAAAIYALGRTAGWVAHALEQRLAGFVIRPRAQYIDGLALGGDVPL